MPGCFTLHRPLSSKLFGVSSDSKYIFSGGHWDNSLQTYSVTKHRTVSTVIRHNDVITCLSFDSSGAFIISGSKDTTSIVWDVYPNLATQGGNTGSDKNSSQPNPRPVQVKQSVGKVVRVSI